MEEKMGFHKTIETSFDFFDRYLQNKENFVFMELYEEWRKKNNLNEESDWGEFSFCFIAEKKEEKLQKIYRYILIEYMVKRNILFLSDENLSEIIVFRDNHDMELYMFLRQKFNCSEEHTELMSKVQKIWIPFKNEILDTIVTFYKPTDRFKRKYFGENNKDSSQGIYHLIVYEILMPTVNGSINIYNELFDSDISQMRIVNQIERKVEEKEKQLEEIEKNIKQKEKKLRRIDDKMKVLNNQLKTIKRKMNNSEKTVITILGIFVSIFTFISINTQFFKESVSNRTGVGILTLLLGINIITLISIFGLLYFIKKLFYEIEGKNKKGINLFLGAVCIVILSFLILIIWRMDNPIKYNLYII